MIKLTKKRIVITIGITLLCLVLFWGMQLLQIRNSVDEYARYWSNQSDSEENKGITYLALGDSTAQAIGASSPTKGYVGLTANEMSARYEQPVSIINASKSGAKLADLILNQLPIIDDYEADLITVSIGSNDIGNYDFNRFKNELDQICQALPSGSIIATLPYFGHGQGGRDAEEASNIIEECARSYNLVVAPLYKLTEDRGWRGMFIDYGADFFHPNDRGYRVWAKAFTEVLPTDI